MFPLVVVVPLVVDPDPPIVVYPLFVVDVPVDPVEVDEMMAPVYD